MSLMFIKFILVTTERDWTTVQLASHDSIVGLQSTAQKLG